MGLSAQRVRQIAAESELGRGSGASYAGRICPECYAPKSRNSWMCRACRRKASEKRTICPDCGRRKKPTSERCRPCATLKRKRNGLTGEREVPLTCSVCQRRFMRSLKEIAKRGSRRQRAVVCSTRCRAIHAARTRADRRRLKI